MRGGSRDREGRIEKGSPPRPRARRVLRWLLFTLLGLVLFAGALAALATLTAWVPAPVEPLAPIAGSATFAAGVPTRLRLATWNIGYAGLDQDTDFVVDGGHMSHPRSRAAVVENLAAMQSFLEFGTMTSSSCRRSIVMRRALGTSTRSPPGPPASACTSSGTRLTSALPSSRTRRPPRSARSTRAWSR